LPNRFLKTFLVVKKDICGDQTITLQRGRQRMAYCKKCGYEIPEGAGFCPRCGTAVVREEAPAAVAAPPSAPVPPVEPVGGGLTLAWWGERFVAWLIDVVIISVVLGIIGILALLGSQPLTLVPGWPDWLPFFSFNLNGIVLFLYWILMDGVYGQSLGKMVMRIKVTRLDGLPINAWEALIESVGKAFLLPLDVLLGWILYPRRRQRLFNYISQTVVIKQT